MLGGTLDILKATFFDRLKKGDELNCPCCGRFAKIYRRRLHTSIALQLIELYRLGGAYEYVHASELIPPGVAGAGDFSKAKYWNLIKPMPDDPDSEKKSSGYWTLSERGHHFVRGLCTIPKYVLVYDDRVLEYAGDPVHIEDCLGNKFSYSELMADRVTEKAMQEEEV